MGSVGGQLTCLFVDNGLLRKGQGSMHKHHRVVVQQAKVWADIIDRGEKKAAKRDGGKSELATLQRKQESMDARRGEKAPVDEATQKLDDQIKAIRLDKGYANPSAANHKQLVAEMQRLMRLRWPD